MSKVYTTKGGLIKDIILESEKALTYKEIVQIFEERADDTVTIPRIRQVVQKMEENEEVKMDKRINEKGNAVSFVILTEGESDEASG